MKEEELLWAYLISKDPKLLEESCVKLTLRKDVQIKKLSMDIDSINKRLDKLEQLIFEILKCKTLGKKVTNKLEEMLDVIELMED